LVNPFKGKGDNQILKHSQLFWVYAVVAQVAMELGVGELYEVDNYEY
jgi:hypothetical protein